MAARPVRKRRRNIGGTQWPLKNLTAGDNRGIDAEKSELPTRSVRVAMVPAAYGSSVRAGIPAARLQIAVLDGEPFGVALAVYVAGVALVDEMAELMDQDVIEVEVASRI